MKHVQSTDRELNVYVCMYAALVTHHTSPECKLQRIRGAGEKCSRLHFIYEKLYLRISF